MSLIINQPAKPRNLIATAIEWLEHGHQVALITLVNIEGNAPYPVGSQMLVKHNGEYSGQITGGCAETALAEQAIAVIKSGGNTHQRYGLNSPFFDIQLPCGSGIDVHFDVETSLTEFKQIHQHLCLRETVKTTLIHSNATFEKNYQPNERLIIFGQGAILISLAELSLQCGFEVICITPESKNSEQLLCSGINAHDLQTGRSLFSGYCDAYTGLVSLFHEHELENTILEEALSTKLFYIGALGSKITHAKRLDVLSKSGLDINLTGKISGPIGIDINARTPTQIAISILAEIIEQVPEHA